ncbi:MAG: penicillin-binding protein 2 [Candidatus Saganbacteria bacterium]|nr:penicillin-binding protein 2 [Candidatus Saganbacteria bacterium]
MIDKFEKNRILILLFFIAAFLFLIARLIDLQIIHHNFYKTKAVEQRSRIITLSADRGDIFDRAGNLLATSIDSYSIYIVPDRIKNKESTARALSRILDLGFNEVISKTYEKKPFVWLKRKINKEVALKVKAAKLPGTNLLSEKERVYPKGSLASQIIGFVGMDNRGLSGIELGLEKYLKGEEGKIVTESDPRGIEIIGARERQLEPQTSGLNVYLTIDETIQYIAERDLLDAVKKLKADSGTCVVMDVKSGEILALASKPDFNPNNYSDFDPKRWFPRVVGDVYEPGSTFKVITVAAGLDLDVITPDTRIYCPDSIEVGGRRIKNSHILKIPTRNLKPEEILAHSVNTGAAQIGIKLGPERFMKYIKAFGFGSELDIGLPGESKGIVKEVKHWSKPDIGMISFGQSIAVTPLQLAAAVCANRSFRRIPRQN